MILHGREVEIQVDDIEPFVNEKYKGFKILWSGNIGFGEYTIYKKVGEDEWYVDDEYIWKILRMIKLFLECYLKILQSSLR